MTTRRSFMAAMLAAAVAPAVARSGVLMPVKQIIVPNPHIAIDIADAVPGEEFNFSMFVRSPGGGWQQMCHAFKADIGGRGGLKILMPSQDVVAASMDLRGSAKRTLAQLPSITFAPVDVSLTFGFPGAAHV